MVYSSREWECFLTGIRFYDVAARGTIVIQTVMKQTFSVKIEKTTQLSADYPMHLPSVSSFPFFVRSSAFFSWLSPSMFEPLPLSVISYHMWRVMQVQPNSTFACKSCRASDSGEGIRYRSVSAMLGQFSKNGNVVELILAAYIRNKSSESTLVRWAYFERRSWQAQIDYNVDIGEPRDAMDPLTCDGV